MECRQSAVGMELKFQVNIQNLSKMSQYAGPTRRQGAKAPRLVFTDPNFLFHACWEVNTGSDHWLCTTTGAKAPRRQGLFSLTPTFDFTHAGR